MEILHDLCEINGTSGREEKVREYILDRIGDKASCTVNPLGCVIAEYKAKPADRKLMISAHMDEVGFIITYINDDGTLSFDCVGGVSPDACAGRQVTVDGNPSVRDTDKCCPVGTSDKALDVESDRAADRYVSSNVSTKSLRPVGNDEKAQNGESDRAADRYVSSNVSAKPLRPVGGGIGTRPIHNLSADERKTPVRFRDLYIDIGAKDREEAERYVSIGDSAYFLTGWNVSRDGYIRSKAIDDRIGCAVMLTMIIMGLPEYDTTFTFVTQEEVGLRGSRTAAFTVQPDMAIVIEATTAADIPLSEGAQRCCELGKGAVVSYMDRSTLYDRQMYDLSRRIAAEKGIGWQTKTVVAGGNDSGAIHISGKGVRTMAISVPCRYLHTPSSVAYGKDMFDVFDLVCEMERALREEI
ncbi:MAG: hypothetical protein IJ251_05995 [Oscillospiraceae bacterium]|nr:hypothetical protein [Oscillospiraceae bacterium]